MPRKLAGMGLGEVHPAGVRRLAVLGFVDSFFAWLPDGSGLLYSVQDPGRDDRTFDVDEAFMAISWLVHPFRC